MYFVQWLHFLSSETPKRSTTTTIAFRKAWPFWLCDTRLALTLTPKRSYSQYSQSPEVTVGIKQVYIYMLTSRNRLYQADT